MAVTSIKLLGYLPTDSPDWAIVQPVMGGNYVTGGDTLNLNPAVWTDPNGKGVLGEPLNPTAIPPAVDSENIGGNYAQVIPGATLATTKIKLFAPGGAEVGAGAMPAAISGGVITVRVPLR